MYNEFNRDNMARILGSKCTDIDAIKAAKGITARGLDLIERDGAYDIFDGRRKLDDWESNEIIGEIFDTHYVSFNNGCTFLSADEAEKIIDNDEVWGMLVSVMDADIRSYLHDTISPCSKKSFLEQYLANAYENLII